MNYRTYLLLLFATLVVNANAQWQYLDSVGRLTDNDTRIGVLQFHPVTNDPYVAVREIITGVSIDQSLKVFDGTSWQYVGDPVIQTSNNSNENTLDFHFGPAPGFLPYVHTYFEVYEPLGTSWVPTMGMLPLVGGVSTRDYGFDVSPTGEPTIAYSNTSCPTAGQATVLRNDGTQWQNIGSCLTMNPAGGNMDLQYSPFNGELFLFHSGGYDQGGFNYNRMLMRNAGTQWDSIASPAYIDPATVFEMTINPVDGTVYLHTLDLRPDLLYRIFRMYTWDGTTLDSIPTDGQIDIKNTNIYKQYKIAIHPVTGEPHILYQDGDTWWNGDYLWVIKKWNGTAWVNTAYTDMVSPTLNGTLDMEFQPGTNDLHIAITQGAQAWAQVIKHADGPSGIADRQVPQLTIYPNPATDLIQVVGAKVDQVSVMDGFGKLLIRSNKSQADVSELANGAYFVRSEGDDWSRTSKLIIAR